MKFHQITPGGRFEYRGRSYVKTGPLTARGPEGGERIIPRSAPVDPGPGGAPSGGPQASAPLRPEAVLAAFTDFERECGECLDRLSDVADAQALAGARVALERAGAGFLERLDLRREDP